MNSIQNKVQLIGHLGNNPEIKNFDDNKVANFSIATNESYKDKNGKRVENTEWHNIVAWGGLATLAENYLQKGKQIAVEGKLRHRSYDGKDGNKHYVTDVLAHDIMLLGAAPQNQ
ncbi:MAG: single-stranded DNA-binding protein [Bacteroidota bacterium]